MVEFARKCDYMLRGVEKSIIMTDHKPLNYFLQSLALDGIYARWAMELRCLIAKIQWIAGARNEVADALSRTVSAGTECDTPDLAEFGEVSPGEGNVYRVLLPIGLVVSRSVHILSYRP